MMAARVVVFVGLLTLDLFSTGWTLQCFECKDSPKPFQCDTVTTCPQHHECIVRQKITTGGLILYDSGCASERECSTHRKRHVRHLTQDTPPDAFYLDPLTQEADSDTFTCLECCNQTDFCNVQGCGIKDLDRRQRGPYCFTCHIQGDKNTCRSITQCAIGEVCILRDTSRNGVIQYQTECIPNTECNGTLNRRSAGDVGVDRCPKCCTDDFCNNDCIHDPGKVIVNGGFSDWGPWGTCSASCGNYAIQVRSRACTNPAPSNGGADCDGPATETTYCNAVSCTGTTTPVNGGFTSWSSWGTCSTTCGPGMSQMSRTCTNPSPAHGGSNCTGAGYRFKECSQHGCFIATPAAAATTKVTAAATTTEKSTAATTTTTTTTRKTTTEKSTAATTTTTTRKSTTAKATAATHPPSTPGHWGHWGACSTSCGSEGVQQRTRRCHDLAHCTPKETQNCNRFLCAEACAAAPVYHFDHRRNVCWKPYITTKATWQDARNRCMQDGADLLVIDNHPKDNLLYGLIHNHFKTETHPIGIWLGLHGQYNDHWRWVHTGVAVYNGHNDVYTNFFNVTAEFTGNHAYDCGVHVTFPANAHNSTFGRLHYTWTDQDCNTPHYFVCEKFLKH